MSSTTRTLGRALADLKQEVLGRHALRFALDVTPLEASNLGAPARATVSLVWEKGSSISFTDAVQVDDDGRAVFAEVMRQTATIYRQSNKLLPKEYEFKLQAVLPGGGANSTKRKTIARAKLDLAQFCSAQGARAAGAATEVVVPLQPQGTLVLSIKSVWLQHYSRAGAAELDGAAETGSVASSATLFDGVDTDELNSGSTELNELLQDAEAERAGASLKQPPATGSSRSAAKLLVARPPMGSSQQPLAAAPFQLAGHGSFLLGLQRSGGSVQPRHRRASSVPDQPPILEADAESCDALPVARTPSSGGQGQQQQLLQSKRSADELTCDAAGCVSDDDDEDGDDDFSSFTPTKLARTQDARGHGSLEGLRALSGSMPAWLWPNSRLALRGVKTEDLMRRIGSSQDVGQLQSLSRGLLCERNDWRFRATQAERTLTSTQQEAAQLRQAKEGLEQQLQQLQADAALLDQLVQAKLQLAQADLQAQALRGQLNKERDSGRQALARLTHLQSCYDALLNSRQAAAAAEGGAVV